MNGNRRYVSESQVRSRKHNQKLKNKGLEYDELLQTFASILNVEGRSFGQLNQPRFGMSDGNEGVQWNITVSSETDSVRVGVNLEGMKYRNWPISTFILSEIANPGIAEIIATLNYPDNTFLTFFRDAWQITSRPSILEKYIGGKEFKLADISVQHWSDILNEALDCLNKEKNYLARNKQTVTLKTKPKFGEQMRLMYVSPHLNIWSELDVEENLQENLERKMGYPEYLVDI